MATHKKRSDYFDTTEGQETKLKLQQMAEDALYRTTASYSADNALHPDNSISFVDKHMNYLVNHPAVEARTYLTNLRLMTKKKI